MRFRPSSCVWLLQLSSYTGELRLSSCPALRYRPISNAGLPLSFARKLRMQSSRNVTTGSSGEQGMGRAQQTRLISNIPTVRAEDTGPPSEKKRMENTLVIQERKLRTPSPLFGANCDDDSEAESFRDGRTEEVDRDTRERAFAWCRDFLSGSWKTIKEGDFQISIVRLI